MNPHHNKKADQHFMFKIDFIIDLMLPVKNSVPKSV